MVLTTDNVVRVAHRGVGEARLLGFEPARVELQRRRVLAHSAHGVGREARRVGRMDLHRDLQCRPGRRSQVGDDAGTRNCAKAASSVCVETQL